MISSAILILVGHLECLVMNFKELRDTNSTFKLAFTHPSLNKTSKLGSYQRLEFLGDKILGFVLAEYLLDHYKKEQEGVISIMLANLVCTETLSDIASKLQLGELLLIDKGEENLGGRTNKTNLEDCIEAVIGAIYKEYGIESVREFILEHWGPYISDKLKIETQDPKSRLQVEMQKRGLGLPEYVLVSAEGDAHNPIFEYKITVDSEEVMCTGQSKKEAQKQCAREMLERLEIH